MGFLGRALYTQFLLKPVKKESIVPAKYRAKILLSNPYTTVLCFGLILILQDWEDVISLMHFLFEDLSTSKQ